MRPFYIGCAVWAYKEWLGDLFPSGSKSTDFLALYSRRLTTVEGNTSFYAVPNSEVVQRWAAETPEETALMALLERYGAGRVLMDVRPLQAGPLPGAEESLRRARDRKPDVPLHPLHSSDIALVRYIGHPDPALNEPLLDEWAGRV